MRDRAQALDDVVTAAVLGDALAGRDVQRAEAEFIDGGLALTVGRYTVSLLEQVAMPLPPWEGLPECFYSDRGCMIDPCELTRQRSDGVEALAVGIALARAFVPLGDAPTNVDAGTWRRSPVITARPRRVTPSACSQSCSAGRSRTVIPGWFARTGTFAASSPSSER